MKLWNEKRYGVLLALLLGGLIAFAITMAMLNHIWFGKLKEFQTLVGGLAVIAAALVAHDAQSAGAREAKRKDEADRESFRRNLCLKIELAALMVAQRAAQHLQDLARGTDNWKNDKFPAKAMERIFSMALPVQIAEAWDHLSIVPADAHSELRRLTWHLDALAGQIRAFADAPKDLEIT